MVLLTVAIDTRSLWMASALCSSSLGALVLIVRKNYPRYLARELSVWGAGYLCLGLAFAIFFARPWVGPLVFRVIGPTLVVLGISLSYVAISELKKQPRFLPWLIGPPLLVLGECLLFTFGKPSTTIELFIFNTINLVLLIRISTVLLRKEGDEEPFVDVLAGFSYAALAFIVFAATIDVLLRHYLDASKKGPTVFGSIVAIVAEGILFSLFLLIVGERVNRDLRTQALHDPLTGLYNRRAFEEIALHQLSAAARSKKTLSVLMFDIDHFKQVNDRHGHPVGDEVLKQTADALGRSLRDEDFLCRWGGDEFCALLPHATRDQAREAAERALRALESSEIKVDGRHIPITISIGVACDDGSSQQFPSLVELADAALYRAKESGRNGCAYA